MSVQDLLRELELNMLSLNSQCETRMQLVDVTSQLLALAQERRELLLAEHEMLVSALEMTEGVPQSEPSSSGAGESSAASRGAGPAAAKGDFIARKGYPPTFGKGDVPIPGRSLVPMPGNADLIIPGQAIPGKACSTNPPPRSGDLQGKPSLHGKGIPSKPSSVPNLHRRPETKLAPDRAGVVWMWELCD